MKKSGQGVDIGQERYDREARSKGKKHEVVGGTALW